MKELETRQAKSRAASLSAVSTFPEMVFGSFWKYFFVFEARGFLERLPALVALLNGGGEKVIAAVDQKEVQASKDRQGEYGRIDLNKINAIFTLAATSDYNGANHDGRELAAKWLHEEQRLFIAAEKGRWCIHLDSVYGVGLIAIGNEDELAKKSMFIRAVNALGVDECKEQEMGLSKKEFDVFIANYGGALSKKHWEETSWKNHPDFRAKIHLYEKGEAKRPICFPPAAIFGYHLRFESGAPPKDIYGWGFYARWHPEPGFCLPLGGDEIVKMTLLDRATCEPSMKIGQKCTVFSGLDFARGEIIEVFSPREKPAKKPDPMGH